MKCTVCKGNFESPIIYGDYPDPGESCRCGCEQTGSPWERGYAIKHLRFLIADFVIEQIGFRIMPEFDK